MDYKRTILHVDDDPQVTRIIAQQLTKRGYEVTSVNDPALALRELNKSHQRIVLLDIDMPVINGLDLLRQIKAEHAGTQVIMVTGIVTLQAVQQSFRWGAESCIFKPIENLEPLVEAIERTFWKIDRWWDVVEYLSQESREPSSRSTAQPEQEDLQCWAADETEEAGLATGVQ